MTDRQAQNTIRGADLKVGDVIYGRRIIRLKPYTVPARILVSSVAAKHPEGLPAWLVDWAEGGGMTVFHSEDYPVEGL